MHTEKKFCPSCGEQLTADTQICTSCGFDFEKREMIQEESSEEKEKKRLNLSNFDLQKMSKKQWGIIGGAAVIIIALLVFLFSGNVSIAGTYAHEDTVLDLETTDTVTISRNGKATFEMNDGSHMKGNMVVYLEEFDGFSSEYSPAYGGEVETPAVYVVDESKNLQLELTFLHEAVGSNIEELAEVELIASTIGLEVKTTDEGVVLSGTLTPSQAYMMDIDLRDLVITEDYAGILVDSDLYIQQ